MDNEKYTYYFRLRPPSIGTQPKGFIKLNPNKIIKNGREYWGSATYDRQLTDKEIYNYDLDYIYSKEELKEMYLQYLIEVFEGNEDDIVVYIDNEEAYDNFINSL